MLTHAAASTPDPTVAHIVASQGTPQQQRRWLGRLASGAVASSVADREPGHRDGAPLATRAANWGDHLVITGTKVTAPLTGTSWVLVVSCVEERTGIHSWVVADVSDQTPGFTRGRLLRREGDRLVDIDVLYFDKLCVSTADLLGHDPAQVFRSPRRSRP